MQTRKYILLSLFLITTLQLGFAQEKHKDNSICFGIGSSMYTDVTNYGVLLYVNYRHKLYNRFDLRAGMSFYQSIWLDEFAGIRHFDNVSGIFPNLGIGFSIIDEDYVKLNLDAGILGRIGGTAYMGLAYYDETIDSYVGRYDVERELSYGGYVNMELQAPLNEKIYNSVSISTYHLEIPFMFMSIYYTIGIKI